MTTEANLKTMLVTANATIAEQDFELKKLRKLAQEELAVLREERNRLEDYLEAARAYSRRLADDLAAREGQPL